jgi:hypothetical protein
MKCPSRFCLAALLAFSACLHAHDPWPSTPREVLSDIAAGVDFKQYFKDIVQSVRKNWYSVIPAEVRAPINKKGALSSNSPSKRTEGEKD